MRFVMCVAAMLAAATAAARTMPIYNGALVNDLDAGGNTVTNLASPVNGSDAATKAYVDSTSGMTPSSVTNIASLVVTNDVASWALKPNPAPVADLTPATNYTDAASNNLATAIAEKFPHTSPWISGDSIGWSSSYRGFMVNGRLTMMNGFDNIINDGGDTLSNFISGGSWNTREQKFTKTSATSGLTKLGANGVLTTAAEGVDYLKTHQDISGKVNTSGATSIDSGANWNCGPYSIYFSADGIRLSGNIILPDTIYNGEHPPYTSYSFSSFATATSISNDFPIVTNAYTKAEANEASTNAANAVYFANVTGDVENISAPIATNAAASVFAEIADYALTNLVTAAYTLRTSEIGNYETTANFTLTLQFADNGRSGDCLLYVANTDAADHEMSLSPDSYTYVSADLAAAKTLKAATTNLVMFTRVNSTTVLVSKTEVK